MSVQHDTLGILDASVVLQSTTIEASLLAETSDSLTVVVGELVHLEDTFSNIGSAHKVNFEELGLKVTLVRAVVNQSFQKESSGLLYSSVLKEDLNNLIN